MTSKEARNIRTQLYVSSQLIANLCDDYPESVCINLAADKIDDVTNLTNMFLDGMIFEDQKVSIEP
jgi:hypothetical protein